MKNALENRSISIFNKHMELFIYLLGSQLMVNLDHLWKTSAYFTVLIQKAYGLLGILKNWI